MKPSITELQTQLQQELKQRSESEQVAALQDMIRKLQDHSPNTSTDVTAQYLKSDWQRLKEYFSNPRVALLYLLAAAMPVLLFITFIYVALWVE
ncbi:hypothetical protein ACE3MZ_01110 [Paenibacillus sp. WLX1005]|uniref:hypothetical protein n=1 Tax=Paenibacillus sp. WLX1005 TaxID=3243766 RepID=UPI003983DCB0